MTSRPDESLLQGVRKRAPKPHYLLIITNLIDEQINLSLRVLYCCEVVNRENLFFTACLNSQLESIFVWNIPAGQTVEIGIFRSAAVCFNCVTKPSRSC